MFLVMKKSKDQASHVWKVKDYDHRDKKGQRPMFPVMKMLMIKLPVTRKTKIIIMEIKKSEAYVPRYEKVKGSSFPWLKSHGVLFPIMKNKVKN